MAVHATDTVDHWHVTVTPEGITTRRGEDPTDVSLAGDASDLYLALWNRGDSPDITIAGDHDVLAAWHSGHRIRWS